MNLLRFPVPGRPQTGIPALFQLIGRIRATGALLLIGALLVGGCRQSLVPVPTVSPAATLQPTSTEPEPPPPTESPQPTAQTSPEFAYSVVWVTGDETLQARQPAGITSMAVASLAADQRGIAVTGRATQLGSSNWVEIFLPEGGTGWVNAWNLTQDVSAKAFCEDGRVPDLVNRFILAVQQRDGGQLAQLVSPKRGLVIRHDWWNPEVVYEPSQVQGIFQDPGERIWGINRDSQQPIEGPFREVILPKLDDVFSVGPEVNCNQLVVGTTAQTANWPSEFTNLNYYSFYRAAPTPGNALNWRTWALGIEFVDGQPYLSLLVQYRGEI